MKLTKREAATATPNTPTQAKRKVRTRNRATKPATAKTATKAAKTTATSQVKEMVYHKLQATPRGKALFTYTLAIFTVLGGFTAGRKAMVKSQIRAFYQSPKILQHHTGNGNLEETNDGNIRLTVSGWNYFGGRLNGSTVGQEVDKPEMQALAEAIRTGKLKEKTARFSADTKFSPLSVKG